MPFYSPRKTVSSYNKESVYGTAPGSLPKYLGGMNPIDRALSNRLVKREGIRDSAETEGYVRGYKDIKFNITLTKWLRADVLEYVFGQQSESGPVSGVYTHVLTVLNTPLHPSMTLEVAERGTTNSVTRLTGVMLDGMTMRWQQGQPISLVLPIIAQDATTGTTILGTATPSSEVQYLGKHLTIRIDGVIVPTNSGEFLVKKGLLAEPKPDAATGDKIAQPKLGEVEYQLDLVFDKQGETGFNAWDDASPHDIEIDIDRGTDDFIHIALNDMYVDDLKSPIDLGNNVNIETLTLRGGSITVTVKDDHAW